jgi:hypothetical protein
MIVSRQKKVIVLDVPRTGTQTRVSVFRQQNVPMDICDVSHVSYDKFQQFLATDHPMTRGKGVNPQELPQFKVFAFYRDPFDRTISAVNLLRRGRLYSRFFHAFYGDEANIKCVSRLPYDQWTQEMKDMVAAVPLIDVFRKMRYMFERSVFSKTHKPWFTEGVIPLNYANFDNEMVNLLAEFDVDATGMTFPQLNSVPPDPQLDYLSAGDEAEIRAYCQEDYDFLASKGITFS